MPALKKISLAVLCVCIFTFCKRSPTTWEDDVVAPLATGSLTLANLFPDTTIKTNTDSSLKIAFETSLINYQLDSLLKIPDTTVTTSFTFPGLNGYIITPNENIPTNLTSTTNVTENVYNLPNGIQLKKAIVKQGKIHYLMTNTVYQPLVYHYQLLSATKNNHILDTIFNLPKADSVTGQTHPISGFIDLAGYTIDFTGMNHSSFNTTDEIDSVHIAPNAQPIGHIYNNQGFNAQFTFEGIVPQYAVGYFGSQSIAVGPDTANFTAFNTIKKGLLNLNSANVNVNIVNQFGVTMKANISQLASINTNNPSVTTLTCTNGQLNNLIVPLAFDNNGPNNPVVNISPGLLSINLNNSNSNIKDFIGNLPNRLSYKLTAQINPPFGPNGGNGNQSGNNDFGYYGTGFSANLSMDVPLYFSASNLMLADTVSLNVSNVSQLQNVNKGNLILTATNQYPFSIYLTAVLLDENKQPIDNLFSNPSLIEAPALDANGKVISPLKSRLLIPLNPQKITNVQKARYVAYSATFNTANQPTQVKFYSNYTLDLLLTADLNYTIGK
ncbi:MAG TPA: hypothetical protein VKG26_07510 [Bacteroidia bacterium]|nr:hypothetical protein [Bacteroidia bacterium]